MEEQKLKDLKIKNYLYQAIDREILDTILNNDTSKNICDSMKQKFQGSSQVKRAKLQALCRDFEILHMKEGETVNSYFARTLKIAKCMKACGESMRENVVTAKILRSMIPKFNYVVCSIEESNNLDTMTIDELQSSLLVHEQRMTDKVEQEDELLLMAYVDFKQGKEDKWFLDSGCSNHMSGNKEWFSKLDENFQHTVKLGNDTRIAVMGKGSVRLNINGVIHTYVDLSNQFQAVTRVLVEKEAGVSIKCLRTNRGGEFTSNEFGEFCKSQDIRRQLTIACTPQQNGVAEWKNKAIMNMVRSMLIGKQVPKIFWLEVTRWRVHILNRCLTTAVQDKTPEEAWSRVKPTVDYFRVFGCIAHVHIPNQRVKLDDKSKKCVLRGVSDESKTYCLFDPVNKMVLISKNVVFEEQKGWSWEQNEEEYQQDILDWGEGEESVSDTEEQYEENVVDNTNARETREQNEENVVDSSLGTSAPPNESHTNNYETPVEGKVRRNIREPVWMIDYEKGGLSDDDGLNVMIVTEDN
ncbi:hypothetical protein CR513_17108, partial [Mucuna pruriens]